MTNRDSQYGVEYQMGLMMAHEYVLRIGQAYKKQQFEKIPVYISVISSLDSETHRKVKTWWNNHKKSLK